MQRLISRTPVLSVAISVIFLSSVLLAKAESANPIDNLQPGHWYEVPNSHLADQDPCPASNCIYSRVEGISGVMNDWNGGAYDTKRDQLVVWGGGHDGYNGNEVYAFNVNTLQWKRLNNPSTDITPYGQLSTSAANPDGTPATVHTYNGVQYAQSADRFIFNGGVALSTWAFNFDTLAWTQLADTPSLLAYYFRQISAYDPLTGFIYVNGAGYGPLTAFDPIKNTWTPRGDGAPGGFYTTAAIDSKRHRMLAVGGGDLVRSWDLNVTGTIPTVMLTTTGDTEIEKVPTPGVAYDPVSDSFVAWGGGDSVYTLNPDTLVWTKHAPAADNTVNPGAQNMNGTFGRFRYVPSKNAFILVNSATGDVFFYKLSSGDGPVVPPTPRAKSSRVQLGESPVDGPNWTESSGSLKYTWTHRGGDYLDASGTENGPTHYATAAPGAPLDVGSLVEKLRSENTGFYVSAFGGTAPKFASRVTATPPRLHVETTTGSFDPPIIVNVWIDASSNHALGTDSADPQISFPGMLKFDLSSVTGIVKNAQLTLTYTNIYAGATPTIAADYLTMPVLVTDPANQIGGGAGGIAATVAKDSDLASNPNILWYPSFNSLSDITAAWGKYNGINNQIVDWPEYGLKAVRLTSHSIADTPPGSDGSTIISWRSYISKDTVLTSGAPFLSTKDFSELYVRYMLKIDPDVSAGMNELGVKLPGFEGTGFSARMEHGQPSSANPGVFRFLIYLYDGDHPFNDPNRGGLAYTSVSLRAGQIYSIEQRIKQNTFTNGTFNRDGVIEIWVDGVKVYSDTSALVNNTSMPSQIDNFFGNFFHGGSGIPLTPIHYEFGGVAISPQYIGPAKKIGSSTFTLPTVSPVYLRNLTIGSRGADVIALQNFLISNGYGIPAGATGFFGSQTRSALAQYQENTGISPPAGYFGPITRAKLNALAVK